MLILHKINRRRKERFCVTHDCESECMQGTPPDTVIYMVKGIANESGAQLCWFLLESQRNEIGSFARNEIQFVREHFCRGTGEQVRGQGGKSSEELEAYRRGLEEQRSVGSL